MYEIEIAFIECKKEFLVTQELLKAASPATNLSTTFFYYPGVFLFVFVSSPIVQFLQELL